MKFQLNYQTTPHCTTGVPLASILFGRTIKNCLPHLITPIAEDPSIKERDTEAKRTIKRYTARKVYVKPNYLRVGDTVIVKSDHTSKALTPYQPNPMTKINKKASMVTATQKGKPNYKKFHHLQNNPEANKNKPTKNPTKIQLNYSSSEGETYIHATTPPKPKNNQAQHTTLNLRHSGRTRWQPKTFDYKPKNIYIYIYIYIYLF